MTSIRSITWHLPDWMFEELDLVSMRSTDGEKMELAIEIARRNIEHGGGPFGAVVFDGATGSVLAPGANLVVGQCCSLLHAEMVAIAFAQARLGAYSFASGRYELVTSSEPCVQCLGAMFWSGLTRLVCGARLADAEAAGFDEGPRSPDWKRDLAMRGVTVHDDVLAARAAEVLKEYARRGGIVYNARAPSAG